jgi:hypothetical protein
MSAAIAAGFRQFLTLGADFQMHVDLRRPDSYWLRNSDHRQLADRNDNQSMCLGPQWLKVEGRRDDSLGAERAVP